MKEKIEEKNEEKRLFLTVKNGQKYPKPPVYYRGKIVESGYGFVGFIKGIGAHFALKSNDEEE